MGRIKRDHPTVIAGIRASGGFGERKPEVIGRDVNYLGAPNLRELARNLNLVDRRAVALKSDLRRSLVGSYIDLEFPACPEAGQIR
ncbi:MAG: hypothetical protein VCC04_02200, partial [Myxococcota bacterium]